jgi:hypothetical protein
MKMLKMLLGGSLFIFMTTSLLLAQTAGDFRSHQSGDWDSTSTWEQYNGSTWDWPAASIPDTLHATTVRTGDSVYVTYAGSTYVGNSTIAPGGNVTVFGVGDSTVRFRVMGGTMTVQGKLKQSGTAAPSPGPYTITVGSTGTLIIANGGTFEQNQNLGQIPIATWDDGSTFYVTGITSGTNPGGNSRQSFYNIVWNCPNQSANANLGFNPAAGMDTSVTVRGNVTVLSTGTNRMYLCGPPAGTVSSHTVVHVTINGNLSVLNGSIVSSNGTSSGYTDIYATVLGNVTVKDSAFLTSGVWQVSQLSISRGSQAGLGTATWYLKGDSIYYGPRTSNSNSTDANTAATTKGRMIFCKPGTQYVYVDSTNQWSGPCNMQFGDSVVATVIHAGSSQFIGSGASPRIKYNATVILDADGFIGGGTNSQNIPSNFAIDDGATLVFASQSGLKATDHGASGPVRVSGNRSYGLGANYEYNGASEQRLGSGFPASVNNLTITNPLGAYIDSVAGFTVNGTLSILNGDLELNGGVITLGPTGTLNEAAGHTVNGSTGSITTTRTLTAPSSASDIAGLGVAIGSSADLGSTVITRGHAIQPAGSGSIKRYFDIVPTNNTGLNATLVFKYDETELTTIAESILNLYKSTDGGTTFASMGGTVNTAANTVTLTGVSDFSRWTAGPPLTIAVNVSYNAGWNLVSLPVTNPLPGDSVRQLLPTSTNPYAFEFSGGYVQRYRMIPGKGYWAKFPSAVSPTYVGTALTRDSMSVVAGWNIVGSISNPVDTSTITSIPAGLRSSNWFGYSGGYTPVTQIIPGKGYWVKATGAGKFIMANPPAAAKTENVVRVEEVLNSLTVTDRNGNSQVLYFGADVQNQIAVAQYDMPPVPPAGAFDARFVTSDGGSMVRTHAAKVDGAVEYAVAIQADAYPLTISWNVQKGTAVYQIADLFGASKEMSGAGSWTISNNEVNGLVIRLVGDGQLPATFGLNQNYPNPFNPSTTIKFSLPIDSRMTLDIFNTLGQRVRSLVNDNVAAGYHEVEWNGTTNAGAQLASGVYFVQMSAKGVNGASFSSVRKLMMLK